MPVSVRLSELPQVSPSDLTNTDLFLITDAEATASKKVTLGQLKSNIFSGQSVASFDDVDISSVPPEDGQFLQWNEATQTFIPGDISLSSLGELADVDLVSVTPIDGQTLIWDTDKFKPGTIDLSPLYALIGEPEGDTDMGVFVNAPYLEDNVSIRDHLQGLANAINTEAELAADLVSVLSSQTTSNILTLEGLIGAVQVAVDNLNIEISPDTLNSINEIAAALQDNPNIISEIQTSISSLQSEVNQNELDSDAEDLVLRGLITSEATTRTSEDNVLRGLITSEETTRTTEQGVQDTRLTALETTITNLDIGIAPETLNSINELAEALGDDPSLVSDLNDQVTALQNTLNKLVPPAPTTLDGLPVNVLTNQGTARLCVGFTDRTGGTSGYVSGYSIKRNTDGSISTDKIQDVGPGDSGQVSAKISSATYDVSTTMTSDINSVSALGLEISDNKDASLSTRDSGIQANFYQVYDIRLLNAGLNNQVSGLHEVSFSHAGNTTDKGYFYEDESTPGAPTIVCSSVYSPMSPIYNYSSGIPHYSNHVNNTHDWGVIISNASGDMYSNHTLVTTSATSTFTDPGDITYTQLGGTNPPAKNFLVGTTANVDRGQYPKDLHTTVSGTVAFSNFTINTPYGSDSFKPSSNAYYNIMGNTSRTNVMDEDNILVSNLGVGVGNGYRVGAGTGDNPVPSHTDWVSTNIPTSKEAIVRGGVLRHDVTNYSTGWHPVGPNFSNRTLDPQYFQVEIRRSAVSQFDISYQGTISGCWVTMPDNTSWNDSLSGTNGWADMFQSYRGSGIPTSAEPGCSSGGVMDNNGGTFTCVFGTESSSNDPESRILVRWKLSDGQSITSMSFSS